MFNFIGLGPQPILEIQFDNLSKRKKQTIRDNDTVKKIPIYFVPISIRIATTSPASPVSNSTATKRSNTRASRQNWWAKLLQTRTPLTLSPQCNSLKRRELDSPGVLMDNKEYRFNFNKFDKEYESYNGKLCKLR